MTYTAKQVVAFTCDHCGKESVENKTPTLSPDPPESWYLIRIGHWGYDVCSAACALEVVALKRWVYPNDHSVAKCAECCTVPCTCAHAPVLIQCAECNTLPCTCDPDIR